MENVKNPLLTTAQAAAYLGLKTSYLHKLMMRRAIPYYKPNNKLCFFAQADLDHWLTGNRIASQEEIEQQAQQYLSKKRRESKWAWCHLPISVHLLYRGACHLHILGIAVQAFWKGVPRKYLRNNSDTNVILYNVHVRRRATKAFFHSLLSISRHR